MPFGSPSSGYVNVGGLKLHYLDWGGKGQTLLLLHGLTSNARSWDIFAPAMLPDYRVIALDQRGHGNSQWADSYLTGDFAADAAGVIQSLSLGKVIVVGLSLGGRNAFVFAARYPDLVDKLVIVDIGPDLAKAGGARVKTNVRTAPAELDSVAEGISFVREANPTFADERIRHQVEHNLRQREDGKWVWKYDPGLARITGRAGREDLWPVLGEIRCPTLIMRGADSDILSPEDALRMKETIRGSQLVEVPEAGHPVPLDNPAGFEAAVKRFLGRPA
ncbi:MAG: alpha/beta hydrolase [Dehalococcoidia bacterium]|nr:alpha/beta hydrolase [Dehalococcoidia bacterium]